MKSQNTFLLEKLKTSPSDVSASPRSSRGQEAAVCLSGARRGTRPRVRGEELGAARTTFPLRWVWRLL